jgi:hypothetical protein
VVAFETDRLVAVSAGQIAPADLEQAPPELRKLSWSGPVLVGTRAAQGNEAVQSVLMSAEGVEPSARPGWWQAYEQNLPQVKQRMRKLAQLRAARPAEAQAAIDAAAAKTGLQLADLFFVPLTSPKLLDGWIALLDGEARIVGYAPVDGF